MKNTHNTVIKFQHLLIYCGQKNKVYHDLCFKYAAQAQGLFFIKLCLPKNERRHANSVLTR